MDRDALVNAMLAQVQARLVTPIEDPAELERLRNGLNSVAERAEALRNFPLDSAVEPDVVFRAYRSETE